jgi:endoglucanase
MNRIFCLNRHGLFRKSLALGCALGVSWVAGALGAATSSAPASEPRPYDPGLAPLRLHTQGNRILDAGGRPVELRGVNIASLEWRNDGDHVAESFDHAIHDWKVSLIRLPLAQDRWFGAMTNQSDGGAAYRALVDRLVDTCAAARVYIDLDLHWSDCGKWANEGGKLGQHLLPDRHSVDFWRDVATRYKDHPLVIFGLYNEPHDVSFAVWRDGGTVTDKPARWNPDREAVTYEGVGMQEIYDAARSTGAANLVTVSGTDWGYDLSGVLEGYAIHGTNLVYETHPYPFKKNWDRCFGKVTARCPVYVGEWGVGGGTNALEYCSRLVSYMARHQIQCWTAWDFHTTAGPTLIKNWSYEPTVFGQYVKEILVRAPGTKASAGAD